MVMWSCAGPARSRAVTRWLKILDLAVTKPSTKTIARALKKASTIDHRSMHVCDTAPVLDDRTKVEPLLPRPPLGKRSSAS